MTAEFTHLDPLGRARMVDVTAKEPSHRRAVARCKVYMESATASKIASSSAMLAAPVRGSVSTISRQSACG